ncbi:hypothetical protein Droror1_Dr00008516 [Drosera rotundifolia]
MFGLEELVIALDGFEDEDGEFDNEEQMEERVEEEEGTAFLFYFLQQKLLSSTHFTASHFLTSSSQRHHHPLYEELNTARRTQDEFPEVVLCAEGLLLSRTAFATYV